MGGGGGGALQPVASAQRRLKSLRPVEAALQQGEGLQGDCLQGEGSGNIQLIASSRERSAEGKGSEPLAPASWC